MGKRAKEPTLNIEVTKQSIVASMNVYLREYRKEMYKALGLICVNETGGLTFVDAEGFRKHIEKAQQAERYFQNAADLMRYYNNLEEN